MKNYLFEGDVVTLTAPYDRLAGQGVLVGSLFGVAIADALSGADIVVQTEGAFTLEKTTGESWTAGLLLYWNNSTKKATTTSSGNTPIGYAWKTAASGDTTGPVILSDGGITSVPGPTGPTGP
jgi:predicted RecA/RadA family phage recombinase